MSILQISQHKSHVFLPSLSIFYSPNGLWTREETHHIIFYHRLCMPTSLPQVTSRTGLDWDGDLLGCVMA